MQGGSAHQTHNCASDGWGSNVWHSSCHLSHCPTKSIVINCHSLRAILAKDQMANRGGEESPLKFSQMDGGADLCPSTENTALSQQTRLGKGVWWFPWVFPVVKARTSQDTSVWGFCRFTSLHTQQRSLGLGRPWPSKNLSLDRKSKLGHVNPPQQIPPKPAWLFCTPMGNPRTHAHEYFPSFSWHKLTRSCLLNV